MYKFFLIYLLLFISLFICSCDEEFEGFYETTYNVLKIQSCGDSEMVEISMPQKTFKYFTLQYESFSLPMYILKACDNIEKKDCEVLYYLDPEDVSRGPEGGVVIDQSWECDEEGVYIKGIRID